MPDTLPGRDDAGAPALPVIDRGVFETLAGMLGQQRTVRMTAAFMADAECRLAMVERRDATPSDLQEHTHGLMSMAGHLGFLRLSALCCTLQERARDNGGMDDRPALRAAFDDVQEAVRDLLDRDLSPGTTTVTPPASAADPKIGINAAA